MRERILSKLRIFLKRVNSKRKFVKIAFQSRGKWRKTREFARIMSEES